MMTIGVCLSDYPNSFPPFHKYTTLEEYSGVRGLHRFACFLFGLLFLFLLFFVSWYTMQLASGMPWTDIKFTTDDQPLYLGAQGKHWMNTWPRTQMKISQLWKILPA